MEDTISSYDTDQIELSSNDKIIEDNLQKSEENVALGEGDDSATDVGLKSSDGDELSSSGEFDELQKLIDNASDKSTINLERNYTYTIGTDNITEGITITKDLTINGNGFAINAQNKSRIFNIESGINVVLNNITFINGYTEGNGGAILAYGNVDISGSLFINNTASIGGAVYLGSGNVVNCNFTSNNATNGSAISMFSGTVENSNFISNNATENGGAIFVQMDISILNSLFENNWASKLGGAVYNLMGLSDSKINSTFIKNSAYQGGAIYVNGKSTNNNFSSQFHNNWALVSGGAVLFHDSVENNRFAGIFRENYAGYGGGIFFSRKTNSTGFNCEFINNTALSCGGAMFFYFTTDKNNFSGIFINNSALGMLDPTVGNGGAITFKNVSTNSIFTCDFVNNTANLNGGGVNYRESPSNITFNSNFINNTSPTGGGVNFFKTFENVVFNGEFIGNSARYGGAIAAVDGIISDVSFRDNIAVMGGAIYFNGTGEVSNCIFTNNEAVAEYDGGGAISMISGNVAGSVFKANKASGVGSMGGAVLIENSGNVTNCRFEDNSAEFGGAVSSDRTVNIADCNFTANRASVEGGAFYTGSCNIENSNFTNNIASNGRYSGDGGAVYINGNATVVNCDFIGNEAPAIYFWNLHESKHVRSISHSTFLNNKANMDSIAPFTLTVNGTNIEIAFHGNNNLFNAILSRLKGDVNVTNVTYWGASGIENTGDSTIVPVMLYTQAGQNVTVRGVVDGVEVNITRSTDAEGKIVLENVREYNITVSHDEDSYYFSGKTFFTSRQLSLNMTDITTNDFTVNITAKSDIFEEYMSGEMIFRVDGHLMISALTRSAHYSTDHIM